MKARQSAALAITLLLAIASMARGAGKDAQVTQIIREVNVLESKSNSHPAAVNDSVREGQAVRTGDKSRSELTFTDLTITRLGANSIFSFNKAGRDVQLDSGSILLRVPKDSGGAGIHTAAVSVAVTGTTVILEGSRAARNKLIVLEGGARLALVKYPKQSQYAHAGQMIDVPPGAKTVPPPVDIDLNQVMRTHPLITDFRPLPSYPLIVAAANQQSAGGPIYQGRPVGPSAILPPWLTPNPTGPGRPPKRGGSNQGSEDGAPPTKGKPSTGSSQQSQGMSPTPTPAPSILRATGSPAPSRAAPTRRRARPTPPPIR